MAIVQASTRGPLLQGEEQRKAKVGRPTQPTVATRPVCIECMSRVCRHFEAISVPPRLTLRMIEIALLVAAGRSNKEIAWETKLTEGTIKVYISRELFLRLGLSNRVEVARWVFLREPQLLELVGRPLSLNPSDPQILKESEA